MLLLGLEAVIALGKALLDHGPIPDLPDSPTLEAAALKTFITTATDIKAIAHQHLPPLGQTDASDPPDQVWQWGAILAESLDLPFPIELDRWNDPVE